MPILPICLGKSMRQNSSYVVHAQSIYYSFSALGSDSAVLHNVSLTIAPGEFVALSGPSGCGKTTLLTLIGGLRSLQSGLLTVLGHELGSCSARQLLALRQQIGMVFQSHHLMDFLTVSQNVQVAMDVKPSVTVRHRRERADLILAELGLRDKLDCFPSMLSGGQKQRVAVARALVNRPSLILADEPTASLDRRNGREIIRLMRDRARLDGVSVLLATHDPRILDMADRVIEIDDGCILPA